jgi:HK97 family phage prohead protease
MKIFSMKSGKLVLASKEVDLKPTEEMAAEAARGLEWRREYNRGGTMVGVARARDISNRTDLSPRTISRMVSYFARHEKDKQAEGFRAGEEGYPSAGRIAWALWGGDVGRTWAESKKRQLVNDKKSLSDNLKDKSMKKFVMKNGKLVLAEKKLITTKALVTHRNEEKEGVYVDGDGQAFMLKAGAYHPIVEADGHRIALSKKLAFSDLATSKLKYADNQQNVCTLCKWDKEDRFTYEEIKAAEVLDDKKRIVDYKDVVFSGYGSTFEGTTARDRDGDSVAQGAFSETIREFMRNPVMLIDHNRSVSTIAGSYTEVKEDKNGLFVVGKVSNSPKMQHVRFLLKEGHLKTLSMGGACLYDETGYRIQKVYLYEISLVAVPANQDAIINTYSMTEDEENNFFKKLKSVS